MPRKAKGVARANTMPASAGGSSKMYGSSTKAGASSSKNYSRRGGNANALRDISNPRSLSEDIFGSVDEEPEGVMGETLAGSSRKRGICSSPGNEERSLRGRPRNYSPASTERAPANVKGNIFSACGLDSPGDDLSGAAGSSLLSPTIEDPEQESPAAASVKELVASADPDFVRSLHSQLFGTSTRPIFGKTKRIAQPDAQWNGRLKKQFGEWCFELGLIPCQGNQFEVPNDKHLNRQLQLQLSAVVDQLAADERGSQDNLIFRSNSSSSSSSSSSGNASSHSNHSNQSSDLPPRKVSASDPSFNPPKPIRTRAVSVDTAKSTSDMLLDVRSPKSLTPQRRLSSSVDWSASSNGGERAQSGDDSFRRFGNQYPCSSGEGLDGRRVRLKSEASIGSQELDSDEDPLANSVSSGEFARQSSDELRNGSPATGASLQRCDSLVRGFGNLGIHSANKQGAVLSPNGTDSRAARAARRGSGLLGAAADLAKPLMSSTPEKAPPRASRRRLGRGGACASLSDDEEAAEQMETAAATQLGAARRMRSATSASLESQEEEHEEDEHTDVDEDESEAEDEEAEKTDEDEPEEEEEEEVNNTASFATCADGEGSQAELLDPLEVSTTSDHDEEAAEVLGGGAAGSDSGLFIRRRPSLSAPSSTVGGDEPSSTRHMDSHTGGILGATTGRPSWSCGTGKLSFGQGRPSYGGGGGYSAIADAMHGSATTNRYGGASASNSSVRLFGAEGDSPGSSGRPSGGCATPVPAALDPHSRMCVDSAAQGAGHRRAGSGGIGGGVGGGGARGRSGGAGRPPMSNTTSRLAPPALVPHATPGAMCMGTPCTATPQPNQGWGARPELGDWGVSDATSESTIAKLMAKFTSQLTMPLSPETPSVGGRGGGGGGNGGGGGGHHRTGSRDHMLPVMPDLHDLPSPNTRRTSIEEPNALSLRDQDEAFEASERAATRRNRRNRMSMAKLRRVSRGISMGRASLLAAAGGLTPARAREVVVRTANRRQSNQLARVQQEAEDEAARLREKAEADAAAHAQMQRYMSGSSSSSGPKKNPLQRTISSVAMPPPPPRGLMLPASRRGGGSGGLGLPPAFPSSGGRQALPSPIVTTNLVLAPDNWKVEVIGGVFLKRFDAGRPVMGSAPPHAPRVTELEVRSGGKSGVIACTITNPSSGTRKVQTFPGSQCHAMLVAPSGLLLSKEALAPKIKQKAYYLPQHLYQFTNLLDLVEAPALTNLASPITEGDDESSNASNSICNLDDSMVLASPQPGAASSAASPWASARPENVQIGSAERGNPDGMQLEGMASPSPLRAQMAALSLSGHLPSSPFARMGGRSPTGGAALDLPLVVVMVIVEYVSPVISAANANAGLSAAGGGSCSMVSKTWARAAAHTRAANVARLAVADTTAPGQGGGGRRRGRNSPSAAPSLLRPWGEMVSAMPWGCFLSEGAYKQVYRTYHQSSERQEAVSVMDVRELLATGGGSVVAQEVLVSLLVSLLVQRGDCPNFVETYDVFAAEAAAPPSLWGTSDEKKPRGSNPPMDKLVVKPRPKAPSPKGLYQYIRMELCNKGDLEEHIGEAPGLVLPEDALRPYAFQMIFSLFAVQTDYHMRHYDVKLLNFMLKTIDEPVGGSSSGAADGSKVVRYGLGGQTYRLEMAPGSSLWVKLADFGTADVDERGLGAPVGLDHYTTLENSPIEQLVLGSGATQGYAADCWSLGLSLLHLFTGYAPYEELLVDAKCPDLVRDRLYQAWATGAPAYGAHRDAAAVGAATAVDGGADAEEWQARYEVIRDVMADPDASLASESMDTMDLATHGQDPTLAETLWRFIVLFGLPTLDGLAEMNDEYRANPIWNTLIGVLAPEQLGLASEQAGGGGGRGGRKGKQGGKSKAAAAAAAAELEAEAACRAEFESHVQEWSMNVGTNPKMAEARRRMQSQGALTLLNRMMNYNAEERPSLQECLESPFFTDLREAPGSVEEVDYSYLKYL